MKRFISAILVSIIALISLSGCLGNGGDYVAEIGGTKNKSWRIYGLPNRAEEKL